MKTKIETMKSEDLKRAAEELRSKYPYAQINYDCENYYIDIRTGLGVSIYPKNQFSLKEAVMNELATD